MGEVFSVDLRKFSEAFWNLGVLKCIIWKLELKMGEGSFYKFVMI